VRKEIGQRVRLRLTPEIRFVYDDSLEEMDLVGGCWGVDTLTCCLG
jgi:ribosome-binding factor A